MKHQITVFLRAGKAVNGPPLGTTLGNYGIQTAKFVKEFNEYTKDLPDYFLLSVQILIFENKSYNFLVKLPSIGIIIRLLKKEELIKMPNGLIKTSYYISLEDFIQLCKFKLPNYDLKRAAKIIHGTLLSSNIFIK